MPLLLGYAGRPRFAVSVSHVADRLVVAISRRGALGMAAETRSRIATNATCRDRRQSPSERRDCRASDDAVAALAFRWVVKEALGTALGSGLSFNPVSWSFIVDEQIKRHGHGDAPATYRLVGYDGVVIGLAGLP